MKKILLLLIVITSLSNVNLIQSQKTIQDGTDFGFKNISQEKIFVHHNTAFLLSGEHLYYKVYCLNTNTNRLSDFSKIAYIELVGEDKTTVFKHKLFLKNGLGQGDFFIPTSVTSGNYKLIAYTQWMRNSEISNFFQNDISILNPFQEDQTKILQSGTTKATANNQPNKDLNHSSSKKHNKDNELIQLNTNANTFTSRNKVTLNIHGIKNELSYGNYSISVRKIDTLQIPEKQTSDSFNSNFQKTISIDLRNDPVFVPELRGELLSGKVFLKATNTPASNVKVALSIPGENYIFKIANTNPSGKYYFNIDKVYDSDIANLYILDDEPDKFELITHQQAPLPYDALDFYNFKITAAAKDHILNYSIQNQIENAYASQKQDSLISTLHTNPFFYNKANSYILDDYTRFKSIRETFIEVIPEVYTRQRNGNFTFHVRIYDIEIETGLLPLVIIDGNLIQNQAELIDFNCNKIKEVNVVSELYMLGSQIFEGVIALNTFKGDYKSVYPNDHRKNLTLSKPIVNKAYFKKVYKDDHQLDRIPDYRRQLLWIPNFELFKNKDTISFYTSDVKGVFEICLEGFNTEGIPVSLKKLISVK